MCACRTACWGDLSRAICRRAGRQARPRQAVRSATAPTRSRPTCSELLDYAERLTRAEIKTWPKGTYRFTDHIDSDGFSDAPIPIKVAITVRDDGTLLVDYTGSSPQVKGALNSTLSFTHSLTYLSVRCVLPKDVPNNVGVFRCIEVKAPEASVLNPVMPGAVRGACAHRLSRVRHHARRAGADRAGTRACGRRGRQQRRSASAGCRPNRKPFIIVDMICGAWGGRPDKDGLEAVTNASQNLSNMPVEVMEAEHPVRVEEYAFVPDSCGAGQ